LTQKNIELEINMKKHMDHQKEKESLKDSNKEKNMLTSKAMQNLKNKDVYYIYLINYNRKHLW
jgi:hypothetical protein